MPVLIDHVTHISSCRDRSQLNLATAEAIRDLHAPSAIRLYAIARKGLQLSFIPLIELGASSGNIFDEYSISSSLGRPLADDPAIAQCVDDGEIQSLACGNGWRYLLPIVLHGVTVKVTEIVFTKPLGIAARKRLFGLVQFYANQLRLLDYGETDTLTGLLNRKTFEENLNRILTHVISKDDDDVLHARRRQQPQNAQNGEDHWLCVVDIDHFKTINDTWGHIYGDEVLLLIAQLMKHCFRFEDKLFRFGGEEFVVMLQPMSCDSALRAFDRFRKMVEIHDFPSVGRITVSIGFTHIRPLDTPTEIIGRADEALYFVKHNGRNATRSYEQLVADALLQAPESKPMDIELF
jgi:diguanylate cyclase (GGDEF)-like protein